MEPTPSTFNLIQVLRAVAALLVVLFHAHSASAEGGLYEVLPRERYLFGFGAAGVHIFFVISGFIMIVASRFEPRFEPLSFIQRRVLRIYPTYWICAGLYLAYHSFLGTPYQLSISEAMGALALWPAASATIIGPAWTLSYEMFFYLSFALAMKLGITRGFIALIVAFLSLILLGILGRPDSAFSQMATNSLLLEFLMGMGIGWLLKRQKLPRIRGEVWMSGGLVLFLLGINYGYDRLPSVVVWGVPSALLVLGAVTSERRYGSKKMMRAIGGLGDGSYSLYLLHILIITMILDLRETNLIFFHSSAVLSALLLSSVCLAASEVFHRKIEKPLLRFLRSGRISGPTAVGREGV